jgi:hypothetical protein
MRAALLNMQLFFAVGLATAGCLSPHGGLRLPWTGEPKPQIYGGGSGRSYEAALLVRRVKEDSLPYIEESWASYYRYRTSQTQAPSWDDFHSRIARETERVGGRVYHVLRFADADGKPQVVYFDVTNVVHD